MRARTLTLPASYPKDPADRVIGATALVEGMVLVTADTAIRRAKVVRTIWQCSRRMPGTQSKQFDPRWTD